MSTHINGNPATMAEFAQQLTAPQLPASLARLGVPPNPTGLVEGVAMSLLDKAATGLAAAYLAKATEEMVTFSLDTNTAATAYSAANVAAVAEVVGASAKVAQQGLSLVQTMTSGLGATTPTTADPAAEQA